MATNKAYAIYMSHEPTSLYIPIKQSDVSGVLLQLVLLNTDNTSYIPAAGATITFAASKADGSGVVQRQDTGVSWVEGTNQVNILLEEQVHTAVGLVACELIVVDSVGVTTSQIFCLRVYPTNDQGDIISSSEYTSLANLLNGLKNAEELALTAKNLSEAILPDALAVKPLRDETFAFRNSAEGFKDETQQIKDSALTEIGDAKTDALTDIGTAGNEALEAIDQDETGALQAISLARTGALGDVDTARTSALSDINVAGNGALNAIDNAKVGAVGAINDAETGTLNDIGLAKTGALNELGTAKDNAVNDVNTTKTTALDEMNLVKQATEDIKTEMQGSLDDIVESKSRLDTAEPKITTLENTVPLKVNQSEYDILQKRFDNLVMASKGIVYNDEVNNAVAYAKTVPVGSQKYATLDSVGGKSVVWNQLIRDITLLHNGITATHNNQLWNISGTITNAFSNCFSGISLIQNHKYYVCKEIVSNPNSVAFIIGTTNAIINLAYEENDKIITHTNSSLTSNVGIFGVTSGTVFDGITLKFYIFDLTQMFGTGNEPTTVEQFKAMFPLDYYAYDAGSILSGNCDKVVSVGKNLIPYPYTDATKVINGITFTDNGDGTITANGTATANAQFNIHNATSELSLKNGVPYTLSGCVGGSAATYKLYVDKFLNGVYIGVYNDVGSGINIIGEEGYTYRIVIVVFSGKTVNNLVFKPQLEENITATTYSPYKAPIDTTIPAEIQSLTGYGWSAGTVYNEVNFANKKYVQRVARVDLGGLTYTANYASITNLFMSSNITDLKPTNDILLLGNLLTSVYTYGNVGLGNLVNMTMRYTGNNLKSLVFKNTNYTDATAFKTAMSGIYLYYELETPIETDLSSILSDDNFIEVEAGGTLTLHQQDDTRLLLPSTETFIVKVSDAI